ncbi:MAG: CHAT domain-containing protein [Acidimicrobiales bacterium]
MHTLTGSAADLRSEAADAFRRARTEPAALLALVGPEDGRHWDALSADPATAAIAHLAIGLAATELHDLPMARRYFADARDIAASAGLGQWVVEADIKLALVLATAGELEAALAQLDRVNSVEGAGEGTGGAGAGSGTVLEDMGSAVARMECQRALILQRLGRTDEALDAYRRGLAALRQDGDRVGEARVLTNRGLLHAYAGRFEVAQSELRRAARLYREAHQPLLAAYIRHNQGFVAARQGDIPSALRAYEGAARSMARLGVRHPAALVDYCETLLRANLITEARQVGRAALEQIEAAGMETDLAEARLLVAEVSLAAGDLDDAEELAVLAELALLAQSRSAWAVMARYAWLRVRWARGDRTEETMAAARDIARDLSRAGWASSAAHARVLSARIALERGDLAAAEAQLATAAARGRRAPADIRIQAWYAEALLRWSRGDAPGAESALRAGMRVLDGYRATLGATELRVNAGHHGSDLGRLALQIAVHCADAQRVLTWAERSRAATVRLTPVRPPADDELALRLVELRALNERVDEAAHAMDDTTGLLREKAALEDLIRRTTWHATGFRTVGSPPPSVKELRRPLDRRVLVEYVESDGVLHAVLVRDGRSQLWRIGTLADIEREVESLRFSLDRLASARGARGSQEVMEQAFVRSADRLDGMLFGEMRRAIGDRPLVLVPTGVLHLLPWHALPSCRDRPLSIAPSAAVWLQAVARPRSSPGPVVLVAGPAVPQAIEELDQLTSIYGADAVTRLDGPAATAKAVTAALDGAGLAHVAAHGSFRADNPLFSSMRMADGPLTVYELERLSQAPRCVVLSSCNAGMAAVRPGNELLGLSSAFFALGTTTLVASVLLVGDDQTRRLMVEFHRLLARGVQAPAALAQAQSLCGGDDVRARASASSFLCYGA